MTNKQKFNTELSSMLDHSTYANRLTMIQRARILYLAKLKFGNMEWDADAFVEAKGFVFTAINQVMDEYDFNYEIVDEYDYNKEVAND